MMKWKRSFFLIIISIMIRFREVEAQAFTGILAGRNGCGWSGNRGPAQQRWIVRLVFTVIVREMFTFLRVEEIE